MAHTDTNAGLTQDTDILVYQSGEYRHIDPVYIRDLTTYITMHIRGYDRLKMQTIVQSTGRSRHERYERLAIIDTRIAALRCLIRELAMPIRPSDWYDTVAHLESIRHPVVAPADDTIVPEPTGSHDGVH